MFWKKTAIGLIVISLFANTAAAQKVGTNVSTSSFVPAPPPSKVTANITVKYDSKFPAAARTAFEYAKNIWARSISSPVPIIINAHWKPLNSRYYGEAKPAAVAKNKSSAMKPNTWYPIALANNLAGRDLAPSVADIEATFNSDYAWYFGTDGKTPATKYDFASAVLHELGHGLGILGSMQVSAAVVGEAKTSSGNFRAFRYIVNTQKMENLSVLPGALQSYARSINNKGEVVGFSSFTNSRTKAFIWDSSASLRVLSSFVSDSALGINSKTQVVGSFRMGDFNSFAFLWSNGKSTPLGTPAIKSSFAQDINDDGTVVGYTNQFPGTGTFRAFKWTSGSGSGSGFTDLGTLPGGTSSKAWEVNDYFDKNGNGKKDTNEFPLVVGESNGHILLRDLGTSNNRELGLGVAYGVNNNGEVVGKANFAGTQSAFFWWQKGDIIDLNRFIANKCPAPGSTWNLQVANDISQSGKIVGKGINCEGQTRAFLLTPTQIGNYDILDLGTLGGTESSAWGVNDSGGPGMWGYTDSPSSTSPLYPYVYDNFIVNSSSQNLINTALFPNSSDKLAKQLISNKIAWSGSKAKLANGGTVPMLYAPSDWKEISSIVHLDENKYPRGNVNSLMTPVLDEGEAIHNPGPVTLGILKDMGW